MKLTDIDEAKTNLSKLLEQVAAGEEVVIARGGKPIARLTKYQEPEGQRDGGQWRGMVRLGDDFDDALPQDMDQSFRGLSS